MCEFDDAELSRRWAQGEREAGNELLSRYFDEIRAFLVNAVPDQDCTDVIQEVFKRLIEANHRFDHRASFRTYLYKIARNTIADYYRKRRHPAIYDPGSQSVEDIDGVGPSTAVALLERCRQLNSCMRRLSIDDRELLELRYWHEFEPSEIAKIFDVPQPTIRTRLHRARKRLQVLWNKASSAGAAEGGLEHQLRALGRALEIPALASG